MAKKVSIESLSGENASKAQEYRDEFGNGLVIAKDVRTGAGDSFGPYLYYVGTRDGERVWKYIGSFEDDLSEYSGEPSSQFSDIVLPTDEFEQLGISDYPEDKPSFERDIDYKDYDITLTNTGNEFTVRVNGDNVGYEDIGVKNEGSSEDIFVTKSGKKVIFAGYDSINNKNFYLDISDDKWERLKQEAEEHEMLTEEWQSNAKEWFEDQPLLVKVEDYEWQKKSIDMSVSVSDEVLVSNKSSLTEEERAAVEELKNIVGKKDVGSSFEDVKPLSLDAMEEGQVFEVNELVGELGGSVDDRITEREQERQREQEQEQENKRLMRKYPDARVLNNTSLEEVENLHEESKSSGERKKIESQFVMDDEHPGDSSSADVVYYITPSGDIVSERIEHH